MANQEKYQLYDKGTRMWFQVSEEQYKAYDLERSAFRKKMQDHGCCKCPRDKWWLCDMMCDDCEFRRAGNMLSLDAPEGDGSVSMLDQMEAEGPRMEEVTSDRDLLRSVIERLRELDPDAEVMLRMWEKNEKVSDRALAEALGCPVMTMSRRMKRLRAELQKACEC